MTEPLAVFLQSLEGLSYRLILVIVPPGLDKISWLIDWSDFFSRTGCGKVAWIAMQPEDQEPSQFWFTLQAALRSSIGDLETSEPFCLETCIEDLINDLAEETGDFFLVFESYHLIDNRVIHSAIQLLLDYLPEQAHIVMISQKEPPLQLARLRVRRQMIEIRLDRDPQDKKSIS